MLAHHETVLKKGSELFLSQEKVQLACLFVRRLSMLLYILLKRAELQARGLPLSSNLLKEEGYFLFPWQNGGHQSSGSLWVKHAGVRDCK